MDMTKTSISIHGDLHGYPYPRQAWTLEQERKQSWSPGSGFGVYFYYGQHTGRTSASAECHKRRSKKLLGGASFDKPEQGQQA